MINIEVKKTNTATLNIAKKMKSMINNDEYIFWLENFTLEHSKFYNDDFGYSVNDRDKHVQENIRDLNLLYKVIENYAKENYIYPTPTNCGNYYSIKHNDIGYNIGIMLGQETIYYCARTNEEKNYINFEDIQQNKMQPTAELINDKMENFTKLIASMIESDIPIEVISSATEKTLQKTLKINSIKNRTYY